MPAHVHLCLSIMIRFAAVVLMPALSLINADAKTTFRLLTISVYVLINFNSVNLLIPVNAASILFRKVNNVNAWICLKKLELSVFVLKVSPLPKKRFVNVTESLTKMCVFNVIFLVSNVLLLDSIAFLIKLDFTWLYQELV